MMKAVYFNAYGGVDEMQYGELADPVPGENDVLIKVAAASVNPVDWKIREGRLKFLSGKNFPIIPGSELAGTVLSVGKEVVDFGPGDRVFAGLSHKGGAYAELVAVNHKKASRIPDELPFPEASTMAIAGLTPLQSLTIHYRVKPGDHVLINGGSGGVGTYAIQIAKVLGAKVTAVCSERNIALVRSLGANEVIDYTKEDFRERKNAYDLILDAASNASFKEVRSCLKKGGMLIKLNLSVKSLLLSLYLGIFSSRKLKMILVKNRSEDLKWMIEQILSGSIRVVMDKTYPLEKAREAHEYSESGRAKGKLVLIV